MQLLPYYLHQQPCVNHVRETRFLLGNVQVNGLLFKRGVVNGFLFKRGVVNRFLFKRGMSFRPEYQERDA